MVFNVFYEKTILYCRFQRQISLVLLNIIKYIQNGELIKLKIPIQEYYTNIR